MRAKWLEMVMGTCGTLVLLATLSSTVGLGPAGWWLGSAAGLGVTALLAVARRRNAGWRVGPADRVTLTRAVLGAGVTGLVADDAGTSAATTAIVTLAVIALLLDAVDGKVARRTGTVTALGARFDAEVDAFLILVLSIEVSRDYGSWVLLIGAARYAFLVAGWALHWLAAPLPSRLWGKAVAAVQGVVLTAAASGLITPLIGMALVGVALLLLVQSFGHDVVWLYRRGAGAVTRSVVRTSGAVLAAAVVWAALVAPTRIDQLTPAAFARIPLEALTLVAIALMLPSRPRRVVAAIAGIAFGLLTVVKVFDMAFQAQLDRPFNVVSDWNNVVLGIGVVRDSVGGRLTDELLVLAGLGIVLAVCVVVASTIHLCTLAATHRRHSAGGVLLLGVVWVTSAAMSLQLAPGDSVASVTTARLAVSQVQSAEAAIHDQQHFESVLHNTDPSSGIPASDLLARLRGHDVLLVFVESYGQVAVRGSSFAPGVDRVLHAGDTALARAGYSTHSAFLTSPTFGGMSWLAHSTLQSGLWIDSQQRFDDLMSSKRLTLSSAFGAAGWRTVSDNPADKRSWGAGSSFYHYDRLYGRRDVGYRGPRFGWAAMPDQYTLSAFQNRELGRGHAPVMAEIDLVSSHTPWTPLPHMVAWNRVGNGSVFDPMPAAGLSAADAWQHSSTVQRLYGQSIQYSMRALTSWIARLHDKNLVVMLLGDHQPATTVSGYNATHEVPMSIVTGDPAVGARIAGWHWQSGLLPGQDAPVWPMDAFRDRFLTTFSAVRASTKSGTGR